MESWMDAIMKGYSDANVPTKNVMGFKIVAGGELSARLKFAALAGEAYRTWLNYKLGKESDYTRRYLGRLSYREARRHDLAQERLAERAMEMREREDRELRDAINSLLEESGNSNTAQKYFSTSQQQTTSANTTQSQPTESYGYVESYGLDSPLHRTDLSDLGGR